MYYELETLWSVGQWSVTSEQTGQGSHGFKGTEGGMKSFYLSMLVFLCILRGLFYAYMIINMYILS